MIISLLQAYLIEKRPFERRQPVAIYDVCRDKGMPHDEAFEHVLSYIRIREEKQHVADRTSTKP
jgi:hypothetical protein